MGAASIMTSMARVRELVRVGMGREPGLAVGLHTKDTSCAWLLLGIGAAIIVAEGGMKEDASYIG